MPLEHLTNCHGEWTIFAATTGYASFVFLWLKLKWQTFKGGQE